MRVGKLRDLVSLIVDGQDIGTILVDIDDREAQIPFDSGLKSSGKIVVRARYLPELVRGAYLKTLDNRLFYVLLARDPDQKKKDLLLSVVELIGAPAAIDIQPAITVRCALLAYRARPESEHGFLPEVERRQAEFAIAEWAPQVGVEFELAGGMYRITEIDPENSDALVTRVWVDFVQYVVS